MLLLSSLLMLLLCCHFATAELNSTGYLTNDEMYAFMRDSHASYPGMTHIYSIGTSIQGTELLVITLSATQPAEHVLLRPETKYIGNMHGNEALGREVLARFIDYMLSSYGSDPVVTRLMDTSRIHVMPTMNPDGYDLALEGLCSGSVGRWNNNSIDLNRDFPDAFDPNHRTVEEMQPESRAVLDWIHSTQFVLSANFHGGSMVANYPYDSTLEPTSWQSYGMPSISEDDDTFQYLARKYSFAHRTMRQGNCPTFTDGITNGADWYPTRGGMQDYNYISAGCMELTMEISCCKHPQFSTIETQWLDNKDALSAYLDQVNIGVKGIVQTVDGSAAVGVEVNVDERKFVKTTSLGEYWKLLLPGSYQLTVNIYGHELARLPITVPDTGVAVYNISLPYNMSTIRELEYKEVLPTPEDDLNTLVHSGENHSVITTPSYSLSLIYTFYCIYDFIVKSL